MTNKKTEVALPYLLEHDSEVKEVMVTEFDTPKMVTMKVIKKENLHVTDPAGSPFGPDDSLFGFATTREAPP
jgi:hypothetical protein